jgi:hypothetical protein
VGNERRERDRTEELAQSAAATPTIRGEGELLEAV